MPKILVADDNSNVQRTVSLALSGLGIEVVAVNNGEAAVRKLSDFTPDLILADIFMPVRNGYEVCEYVKHASQLSQTPVVLLIGAFDPFDEREAQRVGADGILKKPFVPPDPLIAMVKTLLDRVLAARPVPAAVAAGPAISTQRTVAPAARTAYPPAEEMPEDAPEIDYGAREPVAFGEGERPAAFGAMFEGPAVEVEEPATDAAAAKDDSLILTSKRDAALGDPGFWRKEDSEGEPDAAAFEASFSSSSAPREIEHPWVDEPTSAAPPTEEEPAPAEAAHAVIHEVVVETAPTVSQESILQDYAAASTLSVNPSKSPDLAASPLDWMTSAPPTPPAPVAVEAVKTVAEEESEAIAPLVIEEEEEAPAESIAEKAAVIPVKVTPEEVKIEAKVAPVEPAIRPVRVPFEALEEKEAQVSSSLQEAPLQPATVSASGGDEHPGDAPPTKPVSAIPAVTEKWADLTDTVEEALKPSPVVPAIVAEKVPVFVAEKTPAVASSIPWPAAPVAVPPAVTMAPPAASVIAPPIVPVVEPAAVAPVPAPNVVSPAVANVPVTAPPVVSPDPAVVDAVVQRVLEKMSPQVIDIITREFLRPVVQALVKREVERR